MSNKAKKPPVENTNSPATIVVSENEVALQKKVEEQNKKIEEQSSKIDELETKVADSTKTIEEQSSKIDELESELEKAKRTVTNPSKAKPVVKIISADEKLIVVDVDGKKYEAPADKSFTIPDMGAFSSDQFAVLNSKTEAAILFLIKEHILFTEII